MRAWREGVVRERGGGRGFHALEPPRDLDYMKEMYEWCCEAKGGRGKMPRRWDERGCWVRMMAAEMKKAFCARGEGRGGVMDYEELGFRFDARVKVS